MRPGQDGAVGSDSQESEHESILADSSSTTIDVPSDTTRRTSRKRKRDGNAVLPSNLPCRPKVNAAKLLLCICSATRQILKLTVDAVGGDEFATEHMKATLKTTPERAGKILGSSLSVIRQVLQNLGNEPGGANYVDIHECLLLPMIGLWECRATASDDLTTESSNVSNRGWILRMATNKTIADFLHRVHSANITSIAELRRKVWCWA